METMLDKICVKYEEKLAELMGEDEFMAFSSEVGKKLYDETTKEIAGE